MISIIVPIYNSEKTIYRCLDSIINQTYKNIEIILINDGSTDKSLQICKLYERSDSRIRVINQSNKGVSQARNAGIAKAKGEYIQFVDSDDFIDGDMCEKIFRAMTDSNSDLVICGFKSILPWKKRLICYGDYLFDSVESLNKYFIKFFEKAFFSSMCNKLYKRQLINSVLDENLSIGEDLMFNLKYMTGINRITVINQCLYNYMNFSNISLSKKSYDNEFKIISNRYKELKKFRSLNNFDKMIDDYLNKKMIEEILESITKKPIGHFLYYSNYNKFKKHLNELNVRVKIDRHDNYRIVLFEKNKAFLLWSILVKEKISMEIKKTVKYIIFKIGDIAKWKY